MKDFCINVVIIKLCFGLFWKKMKLFFLNNNLSGDSFNDIFLFDNGKVVFNFCVILNEFFVNLRILEFVLNFFEEDFIDYLSIVIIKSKFNWLNFLFIEINLEIMIVYLLKIEIKKLIGYDGFFLKILKFFIFFLVDLLMILFNYCIWISILFSSWKMSNVFLIYKKGDILDKNNY